MKKKRFLFLSLCLSFLWACSNSDEVKMEAGYAAVDLTVMTDTEITSKAQPIASDYFYLPEIGDYTVKIEKTAGESYLFEKLYKELVEKLKVPVGTYKMSVFMGTKNEEGFAKKTKDGEGVLPYLYGETAFSLADQEERELGVSVSLQQAVMTLSYTDAFKRYYQNAEVLMVTKGTTIECAMNETRALLLQPGEVTLNVKVEKNGKIVDRSTKVRVEKQGLYTLQLDANAEAGVGDETSITVSYDDATREEPIELVLETVDTYPAPFLTWSGESEAEFTRMFSQQEGMEPSESSAVTLTSLAGFSSCILKTTSDYLINKGWPAEVDLMNLSQETKEQMVSMGLKIRGFENNSQMAFVNLDKVLAKIIAGEADMTSTFVLSMKDKINQSSEEYTLVCTTAPIEFAIAENVTTSYVWGSKEVVVPIVTDGNPELITASYTAENGIVSQCDRIQIQKTGEKTYNLTLPIAIGTSNKEITLSYAEGMHTRMVIVNLIPPTYTLAVATGDVWAKRATIKVVAEGVNVDQLKSTTNRLKLEYSIDNGASWKTVKTSLNTNTMAYELTDLASATTYKIRTFYNDILQEGIEVSFTTENETQVPNANMNDWSQENQRKLAEGMWDGLSKSTYTAYKPNSGSWATTNTKTFDHGSNYAINAYPSVVSTAGYNGNAAMIRSIGWTKGSGNEYTSLCYQYSAGKMFLGTYAFDVDNKTDTYNYGIPFTSRPQKLTFKYKYDSYNGDKFKVWVAVENRENGVKRLAYGELGAGNAASDFTDSSINLVYDDQYKGLKATHFYIVFSSTNKCSDVHSTESDAIKAAELLHVISSSYWGGSTLCVDDIQLIYE